MTHTSALTGRFVLGTVQLGQPYGRNRTDSLMPESDAFRILDAAWDMGIRAFDTAEAYGASAARLRAWSKARGNADTLEVTTKCVTGSPGQRTAVVEDAVRAALARFEGAGSVVFLTHGAVGPAAWTTVLSVTNMFGATAGQSVYAPEEVQAACSLPRTARVQAPGNALDHRAIQARGDSPVSLDVRSAYLQGVLLEPAHIAGQRAPGSAGTVSAIRAAAATLDSELAPLLLASILARLRKDDRVVIGVDNASQLEALPAAIETGEETIRGFDSAVEHLREGAAMALFIDPRTWPTDAAR